MPKGRKNMFSSTTNSVQSFVRLVVFIIVGLLTSLILVAITAPISNAMFSSPTVLAIPALLFSLWIASIIAKMFYIMPQWEAMVVLRLGRFDGIRGAGFFIIPPFIYSVASIVDMRIETHQVEATATLTKDNVPTKVTAAIEFRVEDAKKATIDVQNYRLSVTWLATEALKNTIGSLDLKELLSERERIAQTLRDQIDTGAAIYGVDVRAVRITDIDTPQSLIDELAAIARAKRSAEAKQIEAEAEVLVAEKINQASTKIEESRYGMRLRELQIINAMSKEQGTTVIIYPYGDRAGEEIAHNVSGRVK